jgi:uncharacterized protein
MTKNRVLVVTGEGEHPALEGRKALLQFISRMGGIAVKQIRSLEQLPSDLNRYHAMVLYFHEEQISKIALTNFEKFVAGGGGVLAIHSVTASFMEEEIFFEVLGGRFLEHGPITKFSVSPLPGLNDFKGVPKFIVEDELYLHETKSDIQPCFITLHQQKAVPLVWTRLYGKGRVCYASPGHQPETMHNAHYQTLLKCGLKWVIPEYIRF